MTNKETKLVRELLALLATQTTEIIQWGIPDLLVQRNIEFIRKELKLDE